MKAGKIKKNVPQYTSGPERDSSDDEQLTTANAYAQLVKDLQRDAGGAVRRPQKRRKLSANGTAPQVTSKSVSKATAAALPVPEVRSWQLHALS